MLDSIGELASIYALADAVFVGGSLEPAGGHNPLEPAIFGKVPIFGSSMENFRDIATGLIASQAAIQVRSGEELAEIWDALLSDRVRSTRLGIAAREFVERSRGATERTLEYVIGLIGQPQSCDSQKRQGVQ